MTYFQRAVCLFALRRYEDAISACTRALAFAPQRTDPKYYMSKSLILLDRPGDARAVLAKIPSHDDFVQTYFAIIAARAGDRAGAAASLAKIRAAMGDSASYQYAQIYAQLGDVDDAFASLDKAVEVRDPGLKFLKRDPFLDPIRRDPRYEALLERVRFPTLANVGFPPIAEISQLSRLPAP